MDRERFRFQSQDYSQFLSSWSFCCHLGSYNFSVRAYDYSWNCVLVHGDSHHERLIAEPVWHHRIFIIFLLSTLLPPHPSTFPLPLLPLRLPTLLAPTLSELTHNVGTLQFRLDSVCSLMQANENYVCTYLLLQVILFNFLCCAFGLMRVLPVHHSLEEYIYMWNFKAIV